MLINQLRQRSPRAAQLRRQIQNMTSAQYPADDGTRPNRGVVVSLLDMGGGKCRVIIDDVRSAAPQRETSWSFDWFYTHKVLNSHVVDRMELSDEEYKGLGIAVMARLLALMGG